MAAPAVLGAGLLLATGVAAAVTVGAGVVGAGLLVRRFREERQGWRDGAAEATPPADMPATE